MTKAARLSALLLLAAGCGTAPRAMHVRAEPQQYTPAMSAVPGIALTPVWGTPGGPPTRYRWSVNWGKLFSWNARGERIEMGREAVTGPGTLYWTYEPTPAVMEAKKPQVQVYVEAEDVATGRILAKGQVLLEWDRDVARVVLW